MFNLLTVDFGSSKSNATGSNGVGYTVYDVSGSMLLSRSIDGVNQTAPGIYSANVDIPPVTPTAQIVWDTGTAFFKTYYATDAVDLTSYMSLSESIAGIGSYVSTAIATDLNNLTSMVAQVMIDVSAIKDHTTGRWLMKDNQMIFYKEDNTTEVARFNLFDDAGKPSLENVFDRRRV